MQPLQAYEWCNSILVEHIPDLVYALDKQGHIVAVNQAIKIYGFVPGEVIGWSFLDLVHGQDRGRVFNAFCEVIARGKTSAQTQRFRLQTKAGGIRWVETHSALQFSPGGLFQRQEGICRDITEHFEAQQALVKAQDELEELVYQHTKELVRANKELQREVEERRQTENQLRQREKELETEKVNLEEANTALKVILKRRDMDKRVLEERVMYNVKNMLAPYMEKMRQKISNERKLAYLNILETNLNDITHDFVQRMSIEFFDLTQSELKVANLIRQGKKSAEIAALLGISIRTVEAYRLGIRRKMGLQNKKANLRTYLTNLA